MPKKNRICQNELLFIAQEVDEEEKIYMADKDRQVRLENEKRAGVDSFARNNKYTHTPERRRRRKNKELTKTVLFNAKIYYDHKTLDNDFYRVPLLIMVKDDYNVKLMMDHHLEIIY